MRKPGLNIKAVARAVAEMHNSLGFSVIDTASSNNAYIVAEHNGKMLSGEPVEKGLLQLPGRVLTPKQVRTFLWEARKRREIKRGNTIVYSVYDATDNVTHLGLSNWVERKTAERAARRGLDTADLDERGLQESDVGGIEVINAAQ